MCTFDDNPKTRRPKEAKAIAYKVFGTESTDKFPESTRYDCFKLGRNVWRASYRFRDLAFPLQTGFQVFAKEKDAVGYVENFPGYYICPVTIYTKDITKATDQFGSAKHKVYEVISFSLWKKDWKKRKIS